MGRYPEQQSSTQAADPGAGFLAAGKGSKPGSGASEAKNSSMDESSGKITGTRLTELWLEVKRLREERRKSRED